jgi:hypothetical protein
VTASDADNSAWSIFYQHPPYSHYLGFIRHDFNEVKRFLANWVNSQSPVSLNRKPTPSRCDESGLDALRPRSKAPEFAFVLLDCAGPWVMWQYRYKDSVDPRMSFLNRTMGWTTVSAACIDDRNNLCDSALSLNGTIFSYRDGGLGSPITERVVSVTESHDGRFVWEAFGEPLSFEQRTRYSSRQIRDRFNSGVLFSYLESLDILVRDPSFFSGDAFDFEM